MSISILGENIKKLRERKKISAYKLSKLANVGNATVSEIESGVRQSLNSNTIEKIAKALDVTTDSLYTTEDNVEYIVTDVIEGLNVFFSSDELTLKDRKMTAKQKKQFLIGAKALLDIIQMQEDDK